MVVETRGVIIVFIHLLISRCHVKAVTSVDPCDPLRPNVTARTVFRKASIMHIEEQDVLPTWFTEPMRYVNCSKRGVNKIPLTISSNVQHLDLSSNSIGQVSAKDFEKFTDLQILRLYSNCIGNSQHSQFFCKGHRGSYDVHAFSSLINLRLLDLGENNFFSFPINLPRNVEYLDIARSGFQRISTTDISYLKNLSVLIARNMCFYCNETEGHLNVDADAFANIPVQIVSINENRINASLLSKMHFQKIAYLNLAASFIEVLETSLFDHASTVQVLDLHLLNPYKSDVHVKIESGTFDKLRYLKNLDLSCNLIEYLSHNIFKHNKRLVALNLSGNCLGKVVLNPSFVPYQIVSLHLGHNQCRTGLSNHKAIVAKLGPVFKNLTSLKWLHFDKPKIYNYLLYSDPIAFHVINNATFKTIQNLSNLTEIRFTDVDMVEVDLATINNLQALNNVQLFNNKIENITSSTSMPKYAEKFNSSKCHRFYKLRLSNNLLQNLHKSQLVHSKVINLDLSVNRISHTESNLFEYMPCLEFIDLRENPIQFIHGDTFKQNKYLKHLDVSNSYYISEPQSLYFLENFHTWAIITLTLAGDSLFRLLYKAKTIHGITADRVQKADLSNNIVLFPSYLEIGLKVFPNVKSLSLSVCSIDFSTFYLPTQLLNFLNLNHNNIRTLSPELLNSIPVIETLLFSFNELSFVRLDLFNFTPKLTHLDLSHNQITSIIKDTTNSTLKKLVKLELQNNYIFKLTNDVFSSSFLTQLKYFDLRWNSIECYCEITLTLGRWLSHRPFYLKSRPGFLPTCSNSLNSFGGCVTCTANQKNDDAWLEQSLLQYATKNFCFNTLFALLAACYTLFCFGFIAIALFLSSSKGMLWMARFSTRRIRSLKEDNERIATTTFVYHGFVIFDTMDCDVGNWVDYKLLPQLTQHPPYFKIGVIGKDDHCGFATTSQLLLKMEASKKVIIVLSKDYAQSSQGKYALTTMEYLSYQLGIDRAVIVTFENDRQEGGLLKRRQKQTSMSLLQYPNDQRFQSIFWESIRHAMM